MTTEQLQSYIKQQRGQGLDNEQIKQTLLQAGWPEQTINQSLGLEPSAAAEVPVPPPPAPQGQSGMGQFSQNNHMTQQNPPEQKFENSGVMNLDPKAVWIFFVRSISGLIFLFVFLSFTIIPIILDMFDDFNLANFFVAIIVLFLALVAFSFYWAKLTYKNYTYELTDHEFKKESGVILKKYVNISYDQVQNVREFRGIMDRILGLADLNIFTAGSGSMGGGRYGAIGEGYLPGLSREQADKLREEITTRSRIERSRRY